MTDAQLIAIAAAIVAVLFNNSRIGDLRTTMDKRFYGTNRHIDNKFALLNLQMKQMEYNIMRIVMRIVGDHERRIQELEQRPL